MHKFSFRFMTACAVMLAVCALASAQNKAFDVSRMDTSTEACTDFFQYANGTWLKNTQIPASESRWGTFNILADNNNAILKEILENAAKNPGPAGSDSQLIGDFYSSCMDEAAIEKAGAKPLKPIFKQIDKIKTTEDLARQIALMHNMGLPVLFGFGGGADAKNSSMVIANAGQGGLTLGNRGYYLDQDAKTVETRQKFMEFLHEGRC
jgi:putative endopeptidase